jgi:regulator of cell morphogenesis and NO signaling
LASPLSRRAYIEIVAKTIRTDQPIGTLAATHAGFRAVFEDLGLDYYCSGQLSVDEAANAAGVDTEMVISAMRRAVGRDPGPDWYSRSLRSLIAELSREHHELLRTILFGTALLLDEAVAAGGAPLVESLRHQFRTFSALLLQHIDREEVSLFPVAESVDDAWMKGDPLIADGDRVRKLISQLVLEHGTLVRLLRDMSTERPAVREIDDRGRRIADAIDSIERHLHQYMNIENQVLFPRVVALIEQAESKQTETTEVS